MEHGEGLMRQSQFEVSDKNIDILIRVVEAVRSLPFGQHTALPWCRESFVYLDAAMKEYETILDNDEETEDE